MRIVTASLMLAVLAGLSSCNSMSKEECAAADWKVIGETDGAAGRNPQDRFAAHVKSCARIKVVPDQTVWYQGYQTGIVRYCTPLSGLTHGEAGDGYHNVCSPELEPGFMRGYGLGRKVYELKSRLSSLQTEQTSKEMDMDRRYNELKAAPDDGQRRIIRDAIEQLDRDIRRARRDAGDVEVQLGAAQRDADWFRQNPQAPMSMPGY